MWGVLKGSWGVLVYTCMYIEIYICRYIHIISRIRLYTYVYSLIYVYLFMYVLTHACLCMHTYIHSCVYNVYVPISSPLSPVANLVTDIRKTKQKAVTTDLTRIK